MANYLITGGAGFIGSHLSEKLLAAGHTVTALDDLSSGSRLNIAHLLDESRFRFVESSVLQCAALGELVASADAVFHLAATVGVFNIIRSPVETIGNNIDGTQAVLRAAAANKTKVLLTSTSEVYGKSEHAPFAEDDDLVLGPTSKGRWSYAASKIIDEFLALAFWREFGVPTVVTRLFNTIGPRQTGEYGMVVPRFVKQALRSQPLQVFGNGQQSRSFTDVNDVVEWLTRLITIDAAVGQVINLGNIVEISITELAQRVLAITGSRSEIEYVPYTQAYEHGFEDIARRVPDISKVVALTGCRPQIGLDETLERIRQSLLAGQVAG
ncbi:NAD-dependent epimerase/dehydratase family protein [Paludibaculum fermentans]|uniref:GDP-mannose 4,6-dehydratase n=1 Tax=Paludibaculum fermentans TaxID=1473598 RepID=A0A7S7NM19_PALFE|nr:NAD-dependent epimerase/dehydratase family protein [Paludibaculum fermentans]QOY86133.1 GDP-mannose 4,6-dehydratase [Paludibaculum fermentans]